MQDFSQFLKRRDWVEPLGRDKREIIECTLKNGLHWIHMAQDGWWTLVNIVMSLRCHKRQGIS
jgi:hypothetical protein